MAETHEVWMRRCLDLARQAAAHGDAAVGALILRDGAVVAEGVEAVRARGDVTAHAEIEAIRAATARLGTVDLAGSTLYTTVEPCIMCAYAIRLARISTVVSGARPAGDAGRGCQLLTDPQLPPGRPDLPVLVRDVLAAECRAVLRG